MGDRDDYKTTSHRWMHLSGHLAVHTRTGKRHCARSGPRQTSTGKARNPSHEPGILRPSFDNCLLMPFTYLAMRLLTFCYWLLGTLYYHKLLLFFFFAYMCFFSLMYHHIYPPFPSVYSFLLRWFSSSKSHLNARFRRKSPRPLINYPLTLFYFIFFHMAYNNVILCMFTPLSVSLTK